MLVVCQAAGDWRPWSIQALSGLWVYHPELALTNLAIGTKKRAYIVRREQDQFEIEEFSNRDDWPRPVMTQSSSETLSKDFLLIGRNAWPSQQNTTMKILGTKLIEVLLWFVWYLTFKLVQSVHTGSLGLCVWGQRAVFVSSVLRGHFSTISISFFCLKFLQGSCRSHHTKVVDQWCTLFSKNLHNCGHCQFNYVTIKLVSIFCFAQLKFKTIFQKAATGLLVPASHPWLKLDKSHCQAISLAKSWASNLNWYEEEMISWKLELYSWDW